MISTFNSAASAAEFFDKTDDATSMSSRNGQFDVSHGPARSLVQSLAANLQSDRLNTIDKFAQECAGYAVVNVGKQLATAARLKDSQAKFFLYGFTRANKKLIHFNRAEASLQTQYQAGRAAREMAGIDAKFRIEADRLYRSGRRTPIGVRLDGVNN